jgi:hypothetical protein
MSGDMASRRARTSSPGITGSPKARPSTRSTSSTATPSRSGWASAVPPPTTKARSTQTGIPSRAPGTIRAAATRPCPRGSRAHSPCRPREASNHPIGLRDAASPAGLVVAVYPGLRCRSTTGEGDSRLTPWYQPRRAPAAIIESIARCPASSAPTSTERTLVGSSAFSIRGMSGRLHSAHSAVARARSCQRRTLPLAFARRDRASSQRQRSSMD